MPGVKRILPGEGAYLSFKIPPELLKEFAAEARVVVRHPWIIGIPVPEKLLKNEMLINLMK